MNFIYLLEGHVRKERNLMVNNDSCWPTFHTDNFLVQDMTIAVY